MTTDTPQRTTRQPRARAGLSRIRGRHRKPRPRKVLLCAGGLALAAGAMSVVRLASVPGPADTAIEAVPRPVAPATTQTPTESRPPATTPTRPRPAATSPSSPTRLTAQSPTPVTRAGTAPPTTPPEKKPPTHQPPQSDTPPQPPDDRQTSPPHPTNPPEQPREPDNDNPPGLCVPVIGLCVGGLPVG